MGKVKITFKERKDKKKIKKLLQQVSFEFDEDGYGKREIEHILNRDKYICALYEIMQLRSELRNHKTYATRTLWATEKCEDEFGRPDWDYTTKTPDWATDPNIASPVPAEEKRKEYIESISVDYILDKLDEALEEINHLLY